MVKRRGTMRAAVRADMTAASIWFSLMAVSAETLAITTPQDSDRRA